MVTKGEHLSMEGLEVVRDIKRTINATNMDTSKTGSINPR